MASDQGRIKSEKRILKYSNRFVCRKERILKPHKGNVGYYTVAPFQKTTLVHSLIALTFIGERPIGYCVDHINGNYLDNRLSNLRYTTQFENVQNALRLGKIKTGELCSWAKLNKNQVISIRADNRAHSVIAKDYPVCRQTIQEIKSMKIWRHI